MGPQITTERARFISVVTASVGPSRKTGRSLLGTNRATEIQGFALPLILSSWQVRAIMCSFKMFGFDGGIHN